MKKNSTEVVIVGAGPYGLSIAAALGGVKVGHRIFGTPMQSWQTMMPKGMFLKSDGFASSLYAPGDAFRLADYCREVGRPYADVGLPVPLDAFVAYGLKFQERFVPHLEPDTIVGVKRADQGFEVATSGGQTLTARRVIVAAGITHFPYLPALLAGLPNGLVTHTSAHPDLEGFRGRKVGVLGAGASAVDTAALLHEAGAQVELIAHAPALAFHTPSNEPRPLFQRLVKPRSGLGLGWRSRLCTDAPLLFHAMPEGLRLRVVRRHLGPSPGWFVRDKVVGRFPLHLGATLSGVEARGDGLRLNLTDAARGSHALDVDHLVAGTGYRVALSRLKFLDAGVLKSIRAVEDTPLLGRSFESSVPGLYFVGLASANAFGPLARFAFGARYTARRLARHLAA